MFCLDDDDFFDYVSNTSRPIHILVHDPTTNRRNHVHDSNSDSEHGSDFDYDDRISTYKLNDALDKNKNSSELVINLDTWDSCYASVFFSAIHIPYTIKTLKLSRVYSMCSEKFKLPHGVTKLKLNNISDLFGIDFSENSELQIVKIKIDPVKYSYRRIERNTSLSDFDKSQEKHFSDYNLDYHNNGYTARNINLSHMYKLYEICFTGVNMDRMERDNFEKTIDKIAENTELPYGCGITFQYKKKMKK